ncbi:MAG: insulinase family protein [Betaproteobacteria bacterium]|nr:insulinase family protein [Betaproteobacteria bacterium]
MKRLLQILLAASFLAAAPLPAQPLEKAATVEGITEYRLPNGLRVLLLPDPGIDTITVHVTYMVGSRHEDYGEKGMAHLLEHMLFKGATHFPDLKGELVRRGARYNGTTSLDRTTYFETLAASDENLAWALAMEADRMTQSFVRKNDLDSEMTVVRNEFEMGENSAGGVLYERMQRLAYAWHNYGNSTIGARSDIENVPIEKLQAFYRRWYQPDNALVIVAGRLDEARTLALVAKTFGAIPRPSRALPVFYTQEPTQDGERSVTLRRAGDTPLVSALYRVPAGSHPEYPAIDVLVRVLGDVPAGRLHRALVQAGLATQIWGAERGLHDPGVMYFGASLAKDGNIDAAREAMLKVLESLASNKIQADEVERARTELLNDFERVQLDTGSLVRGLSEFQATGDWRLFFLYRDRLRKVTTDDVQRAAEHYLKPANRVLGTFVPTLAPQRAAIPPTPDLEAALAGYAGGESMRMGEAFDPTPENIEARVVRKTLANGMRVALLPKKTRGGRVVASLTLHWGDEKGLQNRDVACSFAGAMLSRGTLRHTRGQMKEALEKLNASVSVAGEGASIEVRRDNLEPALRLLAEMLEEPAFPPSEFDELKRAAMSGAEAQRTDPTAVASLQLARHLEIYPKGHPNYTPTIDERIEWMRDTTLEDTRACYRDFFGATGADFAAVGDFDPEALARLVESLLGGWKNPRPFSRIPSRYFERPAAQDDLITPDKANAVLRGGLNVKMRDDDPDFPALVLANYLLGGNSAARLPARVREKEGLSYSTSSSFVSGPFDQAASFRVSSIFAPQNRARVESAVREEIERAVREGFTPQEVETGRKALVQARRLQRSQDGALANRLASYLYWQRTFAWDAALEARIASLDAAQVNAALRRHLDPAKLSFVAAGDFKSTQ